MYREGINIPLSYIVVVNFDKLRGRTQSRDNTVLPASRLRDALN